MSQSLRTFAAMPTPTAGLAEEALCWGLLWVLVVLWLRVGGLWG